VPSNIFATLTTTKLIRLEDNPWHCTCQLEQLRATAVNKIKILDSLTNRTGYQYDRRVAPLCATPEALKGASLFDVIRKPLRCSKVEKLPRGKSNNNKVSTLMAIYGNDVWNDQPQLIEEDETIDHGPEATEEEEDPLSLDSTLPSFTVVDNAEAAQQQHRITTEEDIIDHGEEVVEDQTSTPSSFPFETTTLASKQINNNVWSESSINNFPGDGSISLKKTNYLPAVVTLSKKSMKLRMEQDKIMKSQTKKKFLTNL
jgi:hypothetical protein